MPKSRHTSLMPSPSRRRATKRRRSCVTEHSFHGINTSRQMAKSVTHVSGTVCHLCLRPLTCTATSRRGGGRFLGESQDLGQCTHDGDLAAAARLAGQDFDPIDKRADGFDDLRACRLVLQRLLKFPYLFTIELWKIGMDND